MCDTLICQEREYMEAVDGNPQLRAPKNRHPQYDTFWSVYAKSGLGAGKHCCPD